MHYILVFIMTVLLLNCKTKKESLSNPTIDSVTLNKSDSIAPSYVINRFNVKIDKIKKSSTEWKNELTDQEYYILREKGTERSFSSELNKVKDDGLFVCAGCNTVLFNSNAKFDSGTGWPSFFKPDDPAYIKEDTDYKIGYARTEVLCAVCEGHLGHVFNDGPKPTGLRYCINGAALDFIKAEN